MVGAVQLPVIGIVSVSDYGDAGRYNRASCYLAGASRRSARVTQERTFRALTGLALVARFERVEENGRSLAGAHIRTVSHTPEPC